MSLTQEQCDQAFRDGMAARAKGKKLSACPDRHGVLGRVWKSGWHITHSAAVNGEPFCRVCGCTEECACPSGCCWVDDGSMEGDICSACAVIPAQDLSRSE